MDPIHRPNVRLYKNYATYSKTPSKTASISLHNEHLWNTRMRNAWKREYPHTKQSRTQFSYCLNTTHECAVQ